MLPEAGLIGVAIVETGGERGPVLLVQELRQNLENAAVGGFRDGSEDQATEQQTKPAHGDRLAEGGMISAE